MPTGKLLSWLVLLETAHEGALLKQKVPGPQSPVSGRRDGHQTEQILLTSPKQVMSSQQACRRVPSKLAWLCPATQAVPVHQLSCCLPARLSAALALSARLEVSNGGRQGWGLGRPSDEPSMPR
jgi:hypothetical protein